MQEKNQPGDACARAAVVYGVLGIMEKGGRLPGFCCVHVSISHAVCHSNSGTLKMAHSLRPVSKRQLYKSGKKVES